MTLESDIKEKALQLGFDAVGITTAKPVDSAQVEYFHGWLESGCAAKMGYLQRNVEKRFDPAKLLKGAQSVICVALNYRPCPDELPDESEVRIANFALYEDYHPFMKERLFALAEFINNANFLAKNNCGRDVRAPRFKACVDSVPLAERALAERAGLGFIGRNHMLISPELGNQILLGELITTVALAPDEPPGDLSCGDCGKCIRACPTGALDFDGGFDARKCISYWTIEAPDENAATSETAKQQGLQPPPPCGVLPLDRGRGVDNYIFGCDACILACPHEMNKPPRQNQEFRFHPEWSKLTAQQVLAMTDAEFEFFFAGSGMIRAGLEKMKKTISAL